MKSETCKCGRDRLIRRIFGNKKDREARDDWRKVHNEKLRNFHPSPNTMRMLNGTRLRCVLKLHACLLVGSYEVKGPFVRFRQIWKSSSKMKFK